MSGTRIPAGPPEKSGAAGKLEPAFSPPDRPQRKQAEVRTDGNVPPKTDSQKLSILKTVEGKIPHPGAADSAGDTAVNTGKTSVPQNAPPVTPSSVTLSAPFRQTPSVEQSADSPVPQNALALDLIKQTAAKLGLPGDALSAALITFTRFFSLSLKPEFLGKLRREILASGKSSSPGTAGEKAALEAEALALVAAADKGMNLPPETLERYAKYFMPPDLSDGGDNVGGGNTGAGNESAGFAGGKGGSSAEGNNAGGGTSDKDTEAPPERMDSAPGAEELETAAKAQTQKDGLLDFLNSLPGKNGQYWIVFPFDISIRGTELRVLLRILKKGFSSGGGDEQLIADIAGPSRQWRCFFKKNNGKFRADIRVYPECGQAALDFMRKEVERFLAEGSGLAGRIGSSGGKSQGFRVEEVTVRNGDEIPSWVEDLAAVCLPFVDKDV